MARANKRAESALRRTFRSTAKKWREYYNHDSGRASFAFYAGTDSAKAATELQQLGARVSFLEHDPGPTKGAVLHARDRVQAMRAQGYAGAA